MNNEEYPVFELRVPGLDDVREHMENVRKHIKEIDRELSYIDNYMSAIRSSICDSNADDKSIKTNKLH